MPITEAEVRFQAKNLKPVLDENWAMIAEKDGEVVGAALTLPDVDQALTKMNGRLLPFGWCHFLRRKRYIDRSASSRSASSPSTSTGRRGCPLRAPPPDSAETRVLRVAHMGWILETNKPMNRAMEGMGG